MRPERHQPSVSAVRCEALFVSALQRSEHPDARQVRRAVAAAKGAGNGIYAGLRASY